MSSPSVTLNTTTRASSPISNSAGQTRLPTFSTISKSISSRSSPPTAFSITWAARWQSPPNSSVLICTTGTPLTASRSASLVVQMSPTITALLICGVMRTSVFSRVVVFPEPGELITLRTKMPFSVNILRFCSAIFSLTSSTLRTTLISRVPLFRVAISMPSPAVWGWEWREPS